MHRRCARADGWGRCEATAQAKEVVDRKQIITTSVESTVADADRIPTDGVDPRRIAKVRGKGNTAQHVTADLLVVGAAKVDGAADG